MSDNIIFMGTSKFAVPILEKISESNLNISVVYTQPPKKSNRGMKIQKTPIHVKSELLGLQIRTPNSLKNNIDEYNFIKKIKPPSIKVVNENGAGDALAAMMLYLFSINEKMNYILKTSVACGSYYASGKSLKTKSDFLKIKNLSKRVIVQ